jgi:hypothetical protein
MKECLSGYKVKKISLWGAEVGVCESSKCECSIMYVICRVIRVSPSNGLHSIVLAVVMF